MTSSLKGRCGQTYSPAMAQQYSSHLAAPLLSVFWFLPPSASMLLWKTFWMALGTGKSARLVTSRQNLTHVCFDFVFS